MRRLLHTEGLRYSVDAQPEPSPRRRTGIFFRRYKVKVLIDGCSWHGCPLHATSPKSNAKWWRDKLDASNAHDRDTDRRLARRDGKFCAFGARGPCRRCSRNNSFDESAAVVSPILLFVTRNRGTTRTDWIAIDDWANSTGIGRSARVCARQSLTRSTWFAGMSKVEAELNSRGCFHLLVNRISPQHARVRTRV
ncbi:MAG: hypothetical protein V7694_05580 [Rhodococcus sp. (in: high G+C Gram-positive bacteria)]